MAKNTASFAPEDLRARFHELTKKHDDIRAKSDPLREERDKLVQDVAKKDAALIKKIKDAESDLFDIEMERAAVARALGGRTGSPDEK